MIPWNAITVNQNYKAQPHRDKGNLGLSYLIGFGDYTGGELEILEGEAKGLHDIRYKPIIHNFMNDLHCVRDFKGNRFSLVYYWADLRGAKLPPPSVKTVDGEFRFFRGQELIDKKEGLPHPKRGKTKS